MVYNIVCSQETESRIFVTTRRKIEQEESHGYSITKGNREQGGLKNT